MSDFNIEDYGFDGGCSVGSGGSLKFYDYYSAHKWCVTRQDVIAMAKHFKITEKEIEGFE